MYPSTKQETSTENQHRKPAKMPILDATSLIALSAKKRKEKTSWTVALTLLELVMKFDPVDTLRNRLELGLRSEFCFFSYRDTTADPEEFEKVAKCDNRFFHGRQVFMALFSPYGEIGANTAQQDLFDTPLGDLLHRNSHRSCALGLLQEMLGPNFKITSRSLYEVTKTAGGHEIECHSCPAKWHRMGLFIEFTSHARPRDEYIHSLWPELDAFTFEAPEGCLVRVTAPITTEGREWLDL